ncbi:MAG: hypothetical protein O2963_00130 [Proteobacteria bacterium]|nr:hypothetical protein [Pseudomonadota bacterium]
MNIARLLEARRMKYPPMGDGLDALVKWMDANRDNSDLGFTDELLEYVDKCKQVKQNFMKE